MLVWSENWKPTKRLVEGRAKGSAACQITAEATSVSWFVELSQEQLVAFVESLKFDFGQA
jgi:hypothetical protein